MTAPIQFAVDADGYWLIATRHHFWSIGIYSLLRGYWTAKGWHGGYCISTPLLSVFHVKTVYDGREHIPQ